MAAQALELAVSLTSIDCGECGGTYAINERYRKQCSDLGRSWTCPYCKTDWGYSGNGALDKAKRELEAERQRKAAALERANAAETERARIEKEIKRMKKRATAGVCPCCNRSFVALARHMQSKHPDYSAP